MPSRPTLKKNPANLSIIAFDLNEGEEIFLTCTHGREHGPEIQRTGRGSPVMEHLYPDQPGDVTTDPEGQRLGSWLILESQRVQDMDNVWRRLAEFVGPGKRDELPKFMGSWAWFISSGKAGQPNEFATAIWEQVVRAEREKKPTQTAAALAQLLEEARAHDAPPDVLQVLGLWIKLIEYKSSSLNQEDLAQAIDPIIKDLLILSENYAPPPAAIHALKSYQDQTLKLSAHDYEFIKLFDMFGKAYEIIGVQGCGDLTMNHWNVAYMTPPLNGRELEEVTEENDATFVFLHKEPLWGRRYSGLIKWKAQAGVRPRVTIEDVWFSPHGKQDSHKVWIERKDGKKEFCGDQIEFAFTSRQIIRNGQVVEINRLVHQFSDLRHLLKLPNLNPNGPLVGQDHRPRFYFGVKTSDDVWFGEAQLLSDPNLQRAAMTGPIFLNRIDGLGASIEQVQAAMERAGYKHPNNQRDDLQIGEYRFLPENNMQWVEVYLKQNIYSWTMIGVDEAGDKILCLASEANHAKSQGYTLKQAAEELVTAGAYNALLIDEGDDVFQLVKLGDNMPKAQVADGGLLDITIPLKRTRLRATFIFARETSPLSPPA